MLAGSRFKCLKFEGLNREDAKAQRIAFSVAGRFGVQRLAFEEPLRRGGAKVTFSVVGYLLLPARTFPYVRTGLLVAAPAASPNVIPKEVRLRNLPGISLPLKQKRVWSFIEGDSRLSAVTLRLRSE